MVTCTDGSVLTAAQMWQTSYTAFAGYALFGSVFRARELAAIAALAAGSCLYMLISAPLDRHDTAYTPYLIEAGEPLNAPDTICPSLLAALGVAMMQRRADMAPTSPGAKQM